VSRLADRSDSLKSYILLKPRGPYFFLSRMMLCRNMDPNTSFLYGNIFALFFNLSSKLVSSSLISDDIIFFLMPLGGS
jgi:hypothetical protein